MNMREEFEKWYQVQDGAPDVKELRDIFKLDEDGEYYFLGTRLGWQAWQAAWQAAQPKWIKCSDRTPVNEDIFLLAENMSVWVGCYDEEHKCFFEYSGECVFDLTHWMPLPNPPEE